MTQKNGAHHLTVSTHPPNTHQSLYLTQKTAIFYRRSQNSHDLRTPESLRFTTIPRASQEEENTTTTTNEKSIPDPSAEGQPEKSKTGEITDLGREIKADMKEREGQKRETGFMEGVAEEIREIEWPAFNKVVGTTGVVLGVIAGSCVVLHTVIAILAELSDRVFAGRAAQIPFKRSE